MADVTISALVLMAKRHDELVRKVSRLKEIQMELTRMPGDDFSDHCPRLHVQFFPGHTMGVDIELTFDAETRDRLAKMLNSVLAEVEYSKDQIGKELASHGKGIIPG